MNHCPHLHTCYKVITAMSNTLTLQPENLLMHEVIQTLDRAPRIISQMQCVPSSTRQTHTHTYILRDEQRQKHRQRRTDSDGAIRQDKTDYSKYQPPSLKSILEDNNVAMNQWQTHAVQQKGGTHPPPATPSSPTLMSGPIWRRIESLPAPRTPTFPGSFIHPVQSAWQTNGD